MKPLSRITEAFTESVIREMTRICDDCGGYNLSQGFPDFNPPEKIARAAQEAIGGIHNQYPVTFGEPELRQAISEKVREYNGIVCDPATEITVTCGATEAMIATLKAIINPGDEVVIFEPFYENYGPDTILSGARPRYVALRPPDWSFDLGELQSAFNPDSKAIVLNTPNNPTGKVFTRWELEQIAQLCQRWDCYCVTDEVYEHIIYDGAEHISMASLEGMGQRTVTINSLSKSYSVTGWRVGWAIASQPVTARIRKVHDFLTVGAPTPLQHAGVVAMGMGHEYYQGLSRMYQQARDYLYAVLQETGFKPNLPQGAYYIICQVDDLMERLGTPDDFAFARELIRQSKVATVPGTSFYASPGLGKNQVRFCYSKSMQTLQAVAANLRNLLL